jgi:hypothetical protein
MEDAHEEGILFICGSMNQTADAQISTHLSEYEHSFSPFYANGIDEILRSWG